jgi:hypothetical protein
MNIQELIEKYKKYEDGLFDIGARVACQNFLKDLEQLDELEKVKVPQFVADWYEENKDDFEGNLYRCVYNIPSIFDGAKLNEFERWFLNASTKPFQTLVNMHQFGYEVEVENQYVVTLKNRQPLVKSQSGSILYFSQDITAGNYKVTRKELEDAGFGWVFDCEGVEIEEV